ncbi:MAG: hypothetical protein ACLQU2_22870 [Candidatus Binataceae bacterium]
MARTAGLTLPGCSTTFSRFWPWVHRSRSDLGMLDRIGQRTATEVDHQIELCGPAGIIGVVKLEPWGAGQARGFEIRPEAVADRVK